MANPKESEDKISVVATNRKALHEYHVLEKVEAGIVLVGTEVKSLRARKANLADSYAAFHDGELYLHNMHISPYQQADVFNHEPRRKRKLLLHKAQLRRLSARVKEKGLTLVPLRVYFKGAHAKVEIALARGKRAYDKREAIARRDRERELQRDLSERRK